MRIHPKIRKEEAKTQTKKSKNHKNCSGFKWTWINQQGNDWSQEVQRSTKEWQAAMGGSTITQVSRRYTSASLLTEVYMLFVYRGMKVEFLPRSIKVDVTNEALITPYNYIWNVWNVYFFITSISWYWWLFLYTAFERIRISSSWNNHSLRPVGSVQQQHRTTTCFLSALRPGCCFVVKLWMQCCKSHPQRPQRPQRKQYYNCNVAEASSSSASSASPVSVLPSSDITPFPHIDFGKVCQSR